jgi:CSLREA domain-containing protein
MDLHAWRRGIRSKYLLAALLIAATAPVLTPAVPAHAIVGFVVNTTADTHDANPGNGICADAGGNCSLRAGIEETNALPGVNRLDVPANNYLLTKQLVIEDDLFLEGAGKGMTNIDGNNVTEVLHIRSVELLVCDAGDDSVASYRPNGQRNPDFLSSGKGGLDSPSAIMLLPTVINTDVFVAGYNSGIHRFSATGTYEKHFVKPAQAGAVADAVSGAEDGPFPYLYTADYFPNSRIGVAHHEAGGGATFIKKGTGGLNSPSGVAFYDQDLYVTSTGTNEVLRYDGATGNFVAVFAVGLNTPRDLVFHKNKLYVANEGSDEVLRFDAATGALDGAFVTAGSGSLDGPTDLAFGPDGDLYVISSKNKRILRYDGSTGAYRDVFVQGGTRFLDYPTCLQWRDGAGAGPTVKIDKVTIRNGETLQASGVSGGVTIDQGAFVGIHNSAVRDNDSRIVGGGIRNYGTLGLSHVEVRGNTLPIDYIGGATSTGGGIFNGGALNIKSSLIVDNIAVRGGGIANEGTLEIVNSTVSGNHAIGGGGGIRNFGGVAKINASTITDNHANQPAEGVNEPDRYGGGIINLEEGRVELANTILAENSDNRTPDNNSYSPDCHSPETGHFISYRDNVIGVLGNYCRLKDSVYNDTPYDRVGTPNAPLDPHLTELRYYGSSTIPLHGLLNVSPDFVSPAIDNDHEQFGGDFFNCPTYDQRGLARPQGLRCDSGAFELPQGAGDTNPDLPEGEQPQQRQAEPTASATASPTAPATATPTAAANTPAASPSAAADSSAPTATPVTATTTVVATPTVDATSAYPAPATPTAP